MSLNKYEVYKALQSHTLAFPGNNPVTNLPWTTAERIDDILLIKADADAKLAELAALEPVPAVNDTAVADAVDLYLANLKETDPAQFEIERFLSFDELRIKAGV